MNHCLGSALALCALLAVGCGAPYTTTEASTKTTPAPIYSATVTANVMVNAESTAPIPGATVTIAQNGVTVAKGITDATGSIAFHIPAAPLKDAQGKPIYPAAVVTAQAAGYVTQESHNVPVMYDDPVTLDMMLNPGTGVEVVDPGPTELRPGMFPAVTSPPSAP